MIDFTKITWLKWAVIIAVVGVVGLVGFVIYKLFHNVDTATSAIQKGAIGETIGRNVGNTITGLFGSLWDGIKSWWHGGSTAKQLAPVGDGSQVVASAS